MMNFNKSSLSIFLILVFFAQISTAQQNSGLFSDIISNIATSGADFPLVSHDKTAAVICYDANDYKGVIRTIFDLQQDIDNVTGVKPMLATTNSSADYEIIIGTLGHSKLIDNLVLSKQLDVNELKGKWESFTIATIENPLPGVKKSLIIAGSDKRGTIYGIYELSQQLGVSPWYWWADVPLKKRTSAYVLAGRYDSGEPRVRYRGIFINDEMPCMSSWAKEKFGGMNSKMYAHMFELLLRLRANILWPGMWGSFKEYNPGVPILFDEHGNYEGNCFNEDDPENPRLADEYGIVMGTSHHEPMQRSQQEWIRNKSAYGNGEWNYLTNKQGIRKFFKEGIENTKNYESLITMGMRGDEDIHMVDAGSAEANFKVLENIMKDQRQTIEEVTGKPASETPQVWTLYKEVLEYYDQGMDVPDDMIIVLCDDNWGDVRRLPALNGKKHPGGYGMYYHLAYYGAPRANKWLNTNQIQHMWEQLQLTYSYGVDQLWMLNVGDLKPLEYPIDFFLNMAWNPERFNPQNLDQYSINFCNQQFGEAQGKEAARILNLYCKYCSRITPEMLDDKTYNIESGEFKMVRDEFMALETCALRQFLSLTDAYKDAYKELILFPVQALANLYDMYFAQAMNKKLGVNKDLKANEWADQVEYCFRRDAELCADYNQNIANGKWNHMMDQVHIGYTIWHAPEKNKIPGVIRLNPDDARTGGYVFSEENNVVVMEAEHYFQTKATEMTKWTVIPDLGRTLSAIALMPYNEKTDGAFISYKMVLDTNVDSIAVHLFFDSTLPFKTGGHTIAASFEGGQENIWNINEDLIWENCYTKMYPAGAARIIESATRLALPKSDDGTYNLIIRPLDPGVVFYKIVVDDGGFEQTHLKMAESPYKRKL
ncbi:MAG: glycosyl hydrolase 115 family protein [Prolixibacteraceae bacterium]